MHRFGNLAAGYLRGILLVALVSVGLTFPGIASVPSQAQARSGGGSIQIGPGKTVHVATSPVNAPSTTPSTSAARPFQRASHGERQSALNSPTGLIETSSAPTFPQTTLPSLQNGVPSNLSILQNTALGSSATNQQTSVADEPSVANVGNDVFYTGNFYAALSTDRGDSFHFIDPTKAFPSAYGGFCCDQRVLYAPSSGLVFWALMYSPDSLNNSEIRVAVAHGSSGLESGSWTYYDFTYQGPPTCAVNPNDCPGLPPNLAFDYPQIATSANDFYLTANLYNPDGSLDAPIIFRCPMSDLAAGQTANCTSFYVTNADTFTPADGSGSVMYWADHSNNSQLQVFSWPENVDWQNVSVQTVNHSSFPEGSYSCPSPDGTDMCGSDDWTVRGGWVNGNVAGFLWDAPAGSGGLGSFPNPYVHVVEINLSSMTLLDEPIIWSSQVAYAYAGSAINQSGGVALSAAYAGGGNFPGSALLIRDGLNPAFWEAANIQDGTNGPPQKRWGDFLTARVSGDGQSFLATAFVLQGSCSDNWAACGSVQPRFLWFTRPANANCTQPPSLSGSPGQTGGGQHRVYLPLVTQNACVN